MVVGLISGLKNIEGRWSGGELGGPTSDVGEKAGSRQKMGTVAMTREEHYGKYLNKRVSMGMLPC